jgi:hypothetical protein
LRATFNLHEHCTNLRGHAPGRGAREPQFAAYAAGFRDRALAVALRSLPGTVPDDLRHWTAALSFSLVVDGITLWLETGDPDRDPEVAARLRDLTTALTTAA